MWAQDRDVVYITIKLQDISNEEIVFGEDHFIFRGKSGDTTYDYKLELFGNIHPTDKTTKYNKFGRYTQLNCRKADTRKWWPRLAKTARKLANVGIDWEKWVDDPESSDDEHNHDDGSFEINNTPDADFTSSSDDEDEKKDTKPAEPAKVEEVKNEEPAKAEEAPKVEEAKAEEEKKE